MAERETLISHLINEKVMYRFQSGVLFNGFRNQEKRQRRITKQISFLNKLKAKLKKPDEIKGK
jgi:hypothetical protein